MEAIPTDVGVTQHPIAPNVGHTSRFTIHPPEHCDVHLDRPLKS